MRKSSFSAVRLSAIHLSAIHVRARPQWRSQGWVMAGHRAIRAALGRSGIKSAKREGDGATPAGEFRPVRL
jgi:L,D-peptidoglycan transpeptidase YkuD (ErfK/YbiS/YcfS/YnhG family)